MKKEEKSKKKDLMVAVMEGKSEVCCNVQPFFVDTHKIGFGRICMVRRKAGTSHAASVWLNRFQKRLN